jgi:hypothetical protein
MADFLRTGRGAFTLNFVVGAQPVREILGGIEIGMFYKVADCCRPESASDVISSRIEDNLFIIY